METILNYEESKTKKLKRNEIIECSMKLFIREGIHAVTMADLANESNISLRSLYYYYANKQTLAVDIQIICMYKFAFFKDFKYDESKTTFELLEIYFALALNFMLENENIIKYITTFDYYFHNEYPSEKYTKSLSSLLSNISFTKVLVKANDNSIELFGEDPRVVLLTITQSFLAYSQKIIYREKAMLSENENTKGSLELFIKIILNSIKKR